MSVNRAYITSFWTTGILVASSILVLAVTSAIVAFDRWPGNASGSSVDRVTVGPRGSAVRAPLPAAGAGGAVGSATIVPVRVRPAPTSSQRPNVGGPAPAPVTTAPAPAPAAPSSEKSAPSDPQSPSPPPSPRRSGDPIRQAGGTLGGAIAPASPQAGQAVVQASDVAANVVDAAIPPPRRTGL